MASGRWAPAVSAEAEGNVLGTGMCLALEGPAPARGGADLPPPAPQPRRGPGTAPLGRCYRGEGSDAPLCCLLCCSTPLRCTATGLLRFPGRVSRIPANAVAGISVSGHHHVLGLRSGSLLPKTITCLSLSVLWSSLLSWATRPGDGVTFGWVLGR